MELLPLENPLYKFCTKAQTNRVNAVTQSSRDMRLDIQFQPAQGVLRSVQCRHRDDGIR